MAKTIGINIEGHTLSRKSITDSAGAIIAILMASDDAGMDQKTTRLALETFGKYAPQGGHHISGANINMGDTLPAPPDES